MLSETQKEIVVRQVNASIDVPLVSESSEGNIIDKLVDRLNPAIEPTLRAIMPAVYVECIKIALREGVPVQQKRQVISDYLIAELGLPMAEGLNERVDTSLLPESVEGKVLQQVANMIIREFVEWTVGQIDEQMAAMAAGNTA